MSLALAAGTGAGFADEARRQAHEILSRPPYTSGRPSRGPLDGVLHAIGHGLWWIIGHPLAWLWRHFAVHLGVHIHHALGSWWPLPVLAGFAGVGVLAAWLLLRRRTRIAASGPGALPISAAEDPATLERQADEAERGGDLDAAVRLRYRAGLNRLEAKGIIANRLTRTDSQLRLVVRNEVFDELCDRHESIAYGSQRATPADVAAAREGWPRVLSGSVRRSTPPEEGAA